MSLASFSLVLEMTYYLYGFPLLFADKKTAAWKKKLVKDDVIIRIIAAIFAILAVLALKMQYRITPDAEGLVTFFAWVTFFKAMILVWWPEKLLRWKIAYENRMLAGGVMHVIVGLILIFFGALFTYLGVVLI